MQQISRQFWAVYPPKPDSYNAQSWWMNGSYTFENNQLTMTTEFHVPTVNTNDYYQTYCQLLSLPESYISDLRTAQEEETDLPSAPAYKMDSWAIQYNATWGLDELTTKNSTYIALGNLYGNTLLYDSSDPLFATSSSRDATLAAERVDSN